MTSVLSYDAIVRSLVEQNVPRDKAERRARELTGQPEPAPAADPRAGNPLPLPFSIVLPWSHLVSDDARHAPWVNPKSGKPTIILSEPYKVARLNIASLVRQKMGGTHNTPAPFTPVAEPVQLEALVYVPDNRIHDVPNFAKGVHDALARQVFTNDAWIHRAIWTRAGVDVDRPRAEITISRYTAHA